MARIVYISWPTSEITGGIKMVFRHVEALLEAGHDAIVATQDGVPPKWFQTTASVISLDKIESTDKIVFPENDGDLLERFRDSANAKIVFCQNQFMAFRGIGRRTCYSDYGVSTVICPSYAVIDYCRRRFPKLQLAYVPYYVDHEVFQFQEKKRFQIAFVPRKRQVEAAFVQDLFRAENPEFRSLPWKVIAGMPEADVARTLAESALFLSLSRFESFGLTTLEGLASGCIAAGFTGIGGNEYATSKNGFWSAEDDCLGCAAQLTRAVKLAADGGSVYSNMAGEAINTARQYHRGHFIHHLRRFWDNHVGSQSPSTPVSLP